MKKNKLVHIAITSIMLLSTVLTPQMSHVIASMQAEEADESTQVEPSDVDVVKAEAVDDLDEGANDGDGAEVVDVGSENESEEAENDLAPAEDDEVADETPKDIHNNDPPVEGSEEGSEEVEETSKQLKDVTPMAELGKIFEFEHFKKDGVDIEDGHEVDFDAIYQVEYSWETEGTVKAGDTASLSLPDVFLHWENTPPQPIKVGDVVVGTYTVNNGELVFKFNEKIEDQSVQNGVIGFELKFDRKKFIEEWEQEIDFDENGKKDLTVKVTPTEVNTDLNKTGRTDSPVNAKEIYWTVDIVNGADEPITNGTLADIIPDGLGEPRDFVVREISYDIDGNEVVGEPINFSDPTLTDDGFEMIFASIESRSGYRVEYTTTIDDINKAQFTNDATFVSGDIDLEAKATVSGGERSNPIQKEGRHHEEDGIDYIDWMIIVNENGMSIDNAIVEDTLPSGVKLLPETINIIVNGEATNIDATAFPIELGKINSDEVYTINFRTEVDWSKVNEGDYLENNKFTNTATLFDGEDELNDDDATVWIGRKPILEKVEAGNIDYENRTIRWEVTVNKAKHPLGDVTVTDQLPEGLSLTDIKIIGEDGEPFPEASHTEEDGLLTINLPDVGTETVTIQYTTSIDDFDKADGFKNVAGLTGDGVVEGGEEVEVEIKPHANTYEKNFAGINYKEKTINWRLNVNPIREDINEGFTITDTFNNDGLILLPETVVITLGEETLEAGDDYTLAPIGDGYQNGFTIEFHREIAKAELIVNFTTSYDEQFVGEDGKVLLPHSNKDEAGLYRNHAHFEGITENDREINVEDDASQRVREEAWNSGYKTGSLVDPERWTDASDRKIAWQVYFNYHQHQLGEDVSVTDTLGYDGNIIEETIKVSVYDVDENGNTSITDETLALGKDYTVAIDDEGVLTVSFTNEVSERYVIEFETTVQDISELNYVNNANLKTKEGEYPYSSSVYYDKWDDFLDKVVLPDVSSVYIGEELEWQINANGSLSRIKNATLTDTISAGLSFVEDSFTIETSSGEEIDYTLDIETNEDDKTVLTITFENDLTEAITITYKTIVTAENEQKVNNAVDLDGAGIETITRETEEITAKQFSWIGGEFRKDRGAIEVSKVDSVTGEVIADSEASFELYRVVNGEKVFMGDFTTENGILEVGNLFLGTYILVETEAPEGYRLSEEELIIEVDEAYGTDKIVFKKEFNNISDAAIDIPAMKLWEDENDQDGVRPEFIEVQLLANGKETDSDNLILNAANNWRGVFTGLPVLDVAGEPIKYTVSELDIKNGYESNITGNEEDGFVVTNSREPKVIEISGEKIWKDENNQDGKRPDSITIRLLANGIEVDNIEATEEGNWKYSFTDLPKFENGGEINYTVQEDGVEDYSTEIDGMNITNSYTPEQTSVNVVKAWDDAENQDGIRPESVTVKLLANGKETDKTIELNADNNWQADFTELDVYANGKEIEYTIEEVAVPGYVVVQTGTSEDGYVLTNKHMPELTEVSVTKEWNDEDDLSGFRPDHIEVELYADGKATGKVIAITADEESAWKGSFINLPKYRDEGVQIDYTVKEVSLDEDLYSVEVIPSEEENDEKFYDFTLINTHEVERIDISGTKIWDDANNQDGKRPDSIIVRLLANGKEIDDVEVTEEDEWKYSFTDLPRFENGEKINYTVQENKVEGYSTEIDGTEITNHYTPGKTNVNVVKSWNDNNNVVNRPASITINLFANGEKIDSVKLNTKNNWQANFMGLDEYKDGKKIIYTITEDKVEGFITESIKGNAGDGFVVTNRPVETPDKPEKPHKPSESDPEKPVDDSDLPKTGEAATYTLLALALICLGFGVHYYKKRRSN